MQSNTRLHALYCDELADGAIELLKEAHLKSYLNTSSLHEITARISELQHRLELYEYRSNNVPH